MSLKSSQFYFKILNFLRKNMVKANQPKRELVEKNIFFYNKKTLVSNNKTVYNYTDLSCFTF